VSPGKERTTFRGRAIIYQLTLHYTHKTIIFRNTAFRTSRLAFSHILHKTFEVKITDVSTMRTSEIIHKCHNKLVANLGEIKLTSSYTDVQIYYTINSVASYISRRSVVAIFREVFFEECFS